MLQVSLSIKRIYTIKHLNLYSEINITIKGTGNQLILNSNFAYNSNEVYINEINQTLIKKNYVISENNKISFFIINYIKN